MSDIFKLTEFANSGRGLMCRPITPANAVALQDDMEEIRYDVYNVTDGGDPVTGELDVAEVMLTALAAWRVDSVGYSFLWQAPGSLWPLPSKVYRVVVTFTPKGAGPSFKEVWQITTTDPSK